MLAVALPFALKFASRTSLSSTVALILPFPSASTPIEPFSIFNAAFASPSALIFTFLSARSAFIFPSNDTDFSGIFNSTSPL